MAAHPPQLQHEEEQNIEEEEVQIKANDVYHLPKVGIKKSTIFLILRMAVLCSIIQFN